MRKGWLLVVEALIAITILFGFLFFSISKQPRTKQIFVDEEINVLFEEILNNKTIRESLKNCYDTCDNTAILIRSMISPRINFLIKNCTIECNPPKIENEITSVNLILWENKSIYKFTFYFWLENV